MRHGRWKVPAWLLAIGIAFAIVIHVVLFLQLGARATVAGAFGIGALGLVAKQIGLIGWSRRKVRSPGGTHYTTASRHDTSTDKQRRAGGHLDGVSQDDE
jgi:hypothetical protein